ncbi:hypothetical protein PPERSA_01981 [Pseudocohnilembus persalinus]|uniref:Uncharacterized protein n=1 Tax=Pseudocohnilembus persalinus TaxID=266149 RepID=A0A0V0QF15_PSEPJ|nr:hypothetical protein PPERSA_01981 [Pseudocohnilembus persalinus]|eukprot:KRX00802.1 hypothetical protein PPERSA_01981 [Pseudocohnilembus persalinus]
MFSNCFKNFKLYKKKKQVFNEKELTEKSSSSVKLSYLGTKTCTTLKQSNDNLSSIVKNSNLNQVNGQKMKENQQILQVIDLEQSDTESQDSSCKNKIKKNNYEIHNLSTRSSLEEDIKQSQKIIKNRVQLKLNIQNNKNRNSIKNKKQNDKKQRENKIQSENKIHKGETRNFDLNGFDQNQITGQKLDQQIEQNIIETNKFELDQINQNQSQKILSIKEKNKQIQNNEQDYNSVLKLQQQQEELQDILFQQKIAQVIEEQTKKVKKAYKFQNPRIQWVWLENKWFGDLDINCERANNNNYNNKNKSNFQQQQIQNQIVIK